MRNVTIVATIALAGVLTYLEQFTLAVVTMLGTLLCTIVAQQLERRHTQRILEVNTAHEQAAVKAERERFYGGTATIREFPMPQPPLQ